MELPPLPKEASFTTTAPDGQSERLQSDGIRLRIDRFANGSFKETYIFRPDLDLIWIWAKGDSIAREMAMPEGYSLKAPDWADVVEWQYECEEVQDGCVCKKFIGRSSDMREEGYKLCWIHADSQLRKRTESYDGTGVLANWTEWSDVVLGSPEMTVFEVPNEMEILRG